MHRICEGCEVGQQIADVTDDISVKYVEKVCRIVFQTNEELEQLASNYQRICERDGLPADTPDPFLEQVARDKDSMRKLGIKSPEFDIECAGPDEAGNCQAGLMIRTAEV